MSFGPKSMTIFFPKYQVNYENYLRVQVAFSHKRSFLSPYPAPLQNKLLIRTKTHAKTFGVLGRFWHNHRHDFRIRARQHR